MTGAAGSSDTLIPTVRTSIQAERDVYALFSDTIIHSCLEVKSRMRGQAFLRNAVLVCVTVHTFRVVLTKCCFRLLTT
jgi:hypothetical protein